MKLLALILLALSLAFAALFGLVGLAAWSAARDQCPNGSDCGDATGAAVLGITVALSSLLVGAFALRRLFR
jgi:hypothetical protein